MVAFACCGIHCTERSLSEIDSGQVMVTVVCKDVRRIRLRHGIRAPHPIAQFVMGVILLAPGRSQELGQDAQPTEILQICRA